MTEERQIPTKDELRQLFLQEAFPEDTEPQDPERLKVPDELKPLFLKELDTIITETRSSLERVWKGGGVTKVIDIVRSKLKYWIDITFKRLAHERYCKYIKTHAHERQESVPYPFEPFVKKFYNNWLIIEEKKLFPPAQITYRGRIYQIKGITREAKVFFVGSDSRSSKSPSGVELVNLDNKN